MPIYFPWLSFLPMVLSVFTVVMKGAEAIPPHTTSFRALCHMCIHCGIGKWFAWKPEVTQLSHPSRGPWGGRIPIVIKVPLLFYVPSFALNEGQLCRQSTECQGYNVMCQALVFLFYEISFYNFAVNPPTNYKLGLLETGISIMRNHLSAMAPGSLGHEFVLRKPRSITPAPSCLV